MSFAEPTLLWLTLLAPAAAIAAAWLWRRRLAAAAAWAARGLWDRLLAGYSRRRLAASVALLALAVLGAALALARPRWGLSERTVERRGVDLVFVLDTSLSMGARDVAPSRLQVAKALVRRLAEQMPSNRMALVAAEGRGVVLAPLTLDAAVIDLVLDTAEPGSLPVPGTELAPALATALEVFGDAEGGQRAIVVLSDGEDHGGGLDAVLTRLRQSGVVVHTLGVGTAAGAPVPLPGPADADGERFKRDDSGRPVISRLQAGVLETVASETGGVYVAAVSAAADTDAVRRRIEAMQRRSFEDTVLATLEERFQWPLGLAALALALHLGAGPFRGRRRAAAGGPR